MLSELEISANVISYLNRVLSSCLNSSTECGKKFSTGKVLMVNYCIKLENALKCCKNPKKQSNNEAQGNKWHKSKFQPIRSSPGCGSWDFSSRLKIQFWKTCSWSKTERPHILIFQNQDIFTYRNFSTLLYTYISVCVCDSVHFYHNYAVHLISNSTWIWLNTVVLIQDRSYSTTLNPVISCCHYTQMTDWVI